MGDALGFTKEDTATIMSDVLIIVPTSPISRSDKRPTMMTVVFSGGDKATKFRKCARPQNITVSGKTIRVKMRPGHVATFTHKRDELMKEGARLKKERKEEIDAYFSKIKSGDKNLRHAERRQES